MEGVYGILLFHIRPPKKTSSTLINFSKAKKNTQKSEGQTAKQPPVVGCAAENRQVALLAAWRPAGAVTWTAPGPTASRPWRNLLEGTEAAHVSPTLLPRSLDAVHAPLRGWGAAQLRATMPTKPTG